MRQHWPEGNPEYWAPDTYEVEQELSGEIFTLEYSQPRTRFIQTDRNGDIPRPASAFTWPSDDAVDFGAPRRADSSIPPQFHRPHRGILLSGDK
jgi:hypothetical protein